MKNIEKNKIVELKQELAYLKGQIISKTLTQNDKVSITLFSFWQGEEISTHQSDGDAFVTVLEGKGKFIVGDKQHILQEGQSLIMPKKTPHSVFGEENFKMILIVVFDT